MGKEQLELEKFPTSKSAKKQLSYVSTNFYENSYVGKWLFQVMGMEYDKVFEILEDLPNQFFIETATWGLLYHEIKWGLPVRENLSYEERRKLIYQKRDARAPMSPYAMEEYLSHFTDFEIHIADIHDIGVYGFAPTHPNLFRATFIGEGTLEADRVLGALRKIKQSHTDFIANEWIGILTFLLIFYEIKLHFTTDCYPRHNVPYLFYDGTAHYNGIYRYDKYKIGTKMDFYPMALAMQYSYLIPIKQEWKIKIDGTKLLLPVCEEVEKLHCLSDIEPMIKTEEILTMLSEAKEIPCRYQVNLTVGYHLTKYDGTYQYNGIRRYDSQIIHYEDI